MFRGLHNHQRPILLFISGVSSLIGLFGLTDYLKDYYVSAAVSSSIFTFVLLFVLLSPLYFMDPKKVEFLKSRAKYLVKIALVIFVVLLAVFVAVSISGSALP